MVIIKRERERVIFYGGYKGRERYFMVVIGGEIEKYFMVVIKRERVIFYCCYKEKE